MLKSGTIWIIESLATLTEVGEAISSDKSGHYDGLSKLSTFAGVRTYKLIRKFGVVGNTIVEVNGDDRPTYTVGYFHRIDEVQDALNEHKFNNQAHYNGGDATHCSAGGRKGTFQIRESLRLGCERHLYAFEPQSCDYDHSRSGIM